MKRLFILFILVSIFTSCNCNDDNYESFDLNPFEKGIIPFTAEQNVRFVNKFSDTLLGTISAKTEDHYNLYGGDDESCNVTLVEIQKNTLTLDSSQQEFLIFLQKSSERTDFSISYKIYDFSIENCESDLTSIPSPTDDFTSDGFTFKNIYIFSLCGVDSEISTIIYSLQNGIEFIKYANDDYLKRIE